MRIPALLALSAGLLSPALAATVRVATFNTSLYSERAGGLVERLRNDDPAARKIAAVIQHQRPDILLLNEFDYDADGTAADLFQQRYLAVPQYGQAEISYPYRYVAPVNTGVPSGFDLDGDGRHDGPGDAWGFGRHPGQYGMLVLSRFPIEQSAVRTFRDVLWRDMPGALAPQHPGGSPWYPPAAWELFPLSSKSHWDVPVRTPLGRVHLLAAHPTPPVFDGPEDRNGRRNADEIRFWRDYISTQNADWIVDDGGRRGGLAAEARFVIVGDLNADPADGGGRREAIIELLEHPRILRMATPQSVGAEAAAWADGGANTGHRGAHRHDTAAFGPQSGNLRVDYVLPSTGFRATASGVFWPMPDETGADWLDASDHRMVWVDLAD